MPRTRKTAPAMTLEDREDELILLATEVAEKQLREGTASAQVIVHYLKLGSTKERLEKEILSKQKDLLVAKTDSIQASKTNEETYSRAIEAMQKYTGNL